MFMCASDNMVCSIEWNAGLWFLDTDEMYVCFVWWWGCGEYVLNCIWWIYITCNIVLISRVYWINAWRWMTLRAAVTLWNRKGSIVTTQDGTIKFEMNWIPGHRNPRLLLFIKDVFISVPGSGTNLNLGENEKLAGLRPPRCVGEESGIECASQL